MDALTILYYVLAISTIAFVGIFAYLAYHIVSVARSLQHILYDVQDITDDVKDTKDFIKKDILSTILSVGKTFFQSRYDQRRKTTPRSS